MKKNRILLLAAVMVLAAAAAVAVIMASTVNPMEKPPAGEGNSGPSGSQENKGSVYYLNARPEADAAWQELAQRYTEKTGIPVKVVSVPPGEYDALLTQSLAGKDAPTLFSCADGQSLSKRADYLLDLTDSTLREELKLEGMTLTDQQGRIRAIGYTYESFGIIVNKALLKVAGYELSNITDFESLKAVADDIHSRASQLGFDAFAPLSRAEEAAARYGAQLANMPLYYEFRDDKITGQPSAVKGTYLEQLRNIWDLYITDCAPASSGTGDPAFVEFSEGKAAFYPSGSWEFNRLCANEEPELNLDPGDLAMIPIYCGVKGEENAGLCSGAGDYWAVNAQADQDDIQATLGFLKWVVTSNEGNAMLAQQFGNTPFRSSRQPENVFALDLRKMDAQGRYSVDWVFRHAPNGDVWREDLVSALMDYAEEPADKSWEKVTAAFVDGWSRQYEQQTE